MSGQALRDRIAVAPISWGVCEVPDWGVQMPTERVLREMSELGMCATELGPDGFLPADPAACAAVLADQGMRAVGGFVPVCVHREDVDPWPIVRAHLARLKKVGADQLILAAEAGVSGYDGRSEMTAAQWEVLLTQLDEISDYVASQGLVASLHPHMGTMIETRADVDRVLAGSRVGLCLDTGHLLLGGTDPVTLARDNAARITHVHLKDARVAVADAFLRGDVDYLGAVGDGMYAALGDGDVDVAALVRTLEGAGYQGYYVLEQDTILDKQPPSDAGPSEDVRRSIDFLLAIDHEQRHASDVTMPNSRPINGNTPPR